MAKRILIIGGSAAGPKAASKARRMDQDAEITIIQKGNFLSMASCGYPYFVGGVFDNPNQLISTPTGAPRDSSFFSNVKNIEAIVNTEVTAIDKKKKKVTAKNQDTGEVIEKEYDKLVICTGARPIVPPIPGVNLDGVTTLQSMENAIYLKKIATEKKVKQAVIVGGGLIGIETCEALQLAGIKVTVVEKLDQILGSMLDWEMSKLVQKHIGDKGADLITGLAVSEIIGDGEKVTGIKLENGEKLECQLVVVSIGVRPNVELAKEAGLKIGDTGGIWVNRFMQTSDRDIYAAGDCVEIRDLISYSKMRTLWPMGDAANLQGRVVGQNVVKENTAFYDGAIMTGICKVFDYCAGATGMSEARAKREGFANMITTIHSAPDKPGFMGAKPIIIKLVADKTTGKLLGAQVIGTGDVSKRICIAAMALHSGMNVYDFLNLDLPYAPPFSPAIENFITATHVLENKLTGNMVGISSMEVKAKLNRGETPFLLDVRGPDEFEQMKLGLGETLIPLGKLRKETGSLPKDKDMEIIVYCKISLRGYEASCYLKSIGYSNVKVLEGGLLAWPYGLK